MYEHKALSADTLPAATQLDKLSEEGWEMLQLIRSVNGFILYLRRPKVSARGENPC